MTKPPKQTLQKIIQILRKPQLQREYEQLHFLSLTFKKNINITNININININTSDWWLVSRCIQSLELHNWQSIGKQEIDWIFVLEGKFQVHGITYSEGEQYAMEADDYLGLELYDGSLYSVLSRANKERAIQEAEDRTIAEKKMLVRKILFTDQGISNRDFGYFWQEGEQVRIKKGQQFGVNGMDDKIFIILQGSLNMNYKWKRTIKLRQLGSGSIFSTYLGRYYHKTSQQLKSMQRHQFQITGKTETLLLSFSPDLFYQRQKFKPYKNIVDKAWLCYQGRVAEIKRIIRGIGLMRPEKEEVKRSMREEIEVKFLREKGISVPVAIERRKFRKITSQIFQEKSNRRKIPNKAITQSAKTLQNTNQTLNQQPSPPKSPTDSPLSQPNSKFPQTRAFESYRSLGLKRFNTLPVQNFSAHKRTLSIRGRQRVNTVQTARTANENKIKQQKQGEGSFYRFFRPEEFVSKKLKTHYQSILVNMGEIKLPLDQSIGTSNIAKLKSSKSKKQYFEQYVNQRRIVKLGPKKRLLYKKAPGF